MTVGDKYRVVENPYKYREVWPGFISAMGHYCGRVVTIRSIDFSHDRRLYVKLEEDSGRFWWSPEFLIPRGVIPLPLSVIKQYIENQKNV